MYLVYSVDLALRYLPPSKTCMKTNWSLHTWLLSRCQDAKYKKSSRFEGVYTLFNCNAERSRRDHSLDADLQHRRGGQVVWRWHEKSLFFFDPKMIWASCWRIKAFTCILISARRASRNRKWPDLFMAKIVTTTCCIQICLVQRNQNLKTRHAKTKLGAVEGMKIPSCPRDSSWSDFVDGKSTCHSSIGRVHDNAVGTALEIPHVTLAQRGIKMLRTDSYGSSYGVGSWSLYCLISRFCAWRIGTALEQWSLSCSAWVGLLLAMLRQQKRPWCLYLRGRFTVARLQLFAQGCNLSCMPFMTFSWMATISTENGSSIGSSCRRIGRKIDWDGIELFEISVTDVMSTWWKTLGASLRQLLQPPPSSSQQLWVAAKQHVLHNVTITRPGLSRWIRPCHISKFSSCLCQVKYINRNSKILNQQPHSHCMLVRKMMKFDSSRIPIESTKTPQSQNLSTIQDRGNKAGRGGGTEKETISDWGEP